MKKWLISLTSLLTIINSVTITITNNNTVIQTSNQNINVNISAYDENNKKITSYHYETNFATLAELMKQEKNTYLLKDFGPSLGLYLYGINYYDTSGKNKQN